MNLILNEESLQINEIQDFIFKVRAFLIDENNNLLIANYGNVFLLPGGSINENEKIEDAIIRELKEEVGIDYKKEELTYLNTINYYQKDYPNRNDKIINRVNTTHFFVGKYKGLGKQLLTENEKRDNFKLFLVPIDEVEQVVLNNKNNNPRNKFFTKELLTIINYYKQTNDKPYVKIR